MVLNHHDECLLWNIVDRRFLITVYYWSCLIFYEGEGMLYIFFVLPESTSRTVQVVDHIAFVQLQSKDALLCSLEFH